MRHRTWLLLTLLFTVQTVRAESRSVKNYYMETVMKIRESKNGTCAEIKEDTFQLVAAFYYAMSVISRAQTYPKIRYFTVAVDFCELLNNHQTGFRISKNFYKERDQYPPNASIEYNIFPELQAFLPLNGNQTAFELELQPPQPEGEEIKIENSTDTNTNLTTATTSAPVDETNITTTALSTTIGQVNFTAFANYTFAGEVNVTIDANSTAVPPTAPSNTTTPKSLIKKAIEQKDKFFKFLDPFIKIYGGKTTCSTPSTPATESTTMNTTIATINITESPVISEVVPNVTEAIVIEEKEVELVWPNESSVCFNISKEWLKTANPQLTALFEQESTFSVYKDILIDDYTQNNVPMISNSFEFPPHDAELQFLLGDIFECHEWNIFSVVYSQSVEEKKQYVNFLTNFPDICISEQIGITEDSSDSDYDHLIWLLHTNIHNTKAVLCFCSVKEIKKLLQAASRYDVAMTFNFIFVRDGLMKHLSFSDGFEEQLLNSYVIGRDINYVEEFSNVYLDDYLSSRNSNPWMVDFKQQNDIVVNVTSNETDANEAVLEFVNNFQVNPDVKGIIMGVFAADAALRTRLAPREGSKYYNKNSTFMDIWKDIIKGLATHERDLNNNFLSFNKLRVAKFRKFHDGNTTTYKYMVIENTLSECIDNRQIQLHYLPVGAPAERYTIFKYECLESCPRGYEKISKDVHCLIYDPEDEGWEKIRNCTECVKFPEENVYGHLMIIPMLISVAGVFLTALVSQTFLMHHRTPVIKTSIYLSSIILGSMIAVHCTVILLSLKICVFTCGVFKYVIPLCFTVMYSALLIKVNRMYRAWELPQFAVPNFASKKSAVVLMVILVSFESIMIFIHMTLGKEKIFHDEYIATGYEFNLDRLCPLHSDMTMINYFFNALLVSVTLLYSRVVRGLMHNFFEARCMYWTLNLTFWLWFAFFALYFKSNLKLLVFSICVSVNSLIPLVLVFFPKMYVIRFNPDTNDMKSIYSMNEYQLDTSAIYDTTPTPDETKEQVEKREREE